MRLSGALKVATRESVIVGRSDLVHITREVIKGRPVSVSDVVTKRKERKRNEKNIENKTRNTRNTQDGLKDQGTMLQ